MNKKYIKDQQEVFCDGVMLYYNKDRKRFELGEIVHDGMTWINGLMVDIEWDKSGAPYIEDDGEEEKKDKLSVPWNGQWFINYYHCKDCDKFWQMEWDADCDDKCPKCHSAYTPYKTEEQDNE